MAVFESFDGTRLAYHRFGSGSPVLCLPGGPMQESAYLGDLGGLSARHELIVLDLRGTGDSAVPEDTTTYRVDRQVEDVESFRAHLGMDGIDLLAHSAGAALALLYAMRHLEEAGHFPWLDDPQWLVATVTDFLTRTHRSL